MSLSRWLITLVIGTALALGLFAQPITPLTAPDVEQPRLDIVAPVPQGAASLTQTFTPAHNGLSAVEVLAVVSGQFTGTFTMRLNDNAGAIIAEQTWMSVTHNLPLRLAFTPQAHSRGQMYQLHFIGSRDNTASVWAYSLDGYRPGEAAHNSQPLAGDVRFGTTYTYLPMDMARDALISLDWTLAFAPVWLLILFAPGYVVLMYFWDTAHWQISAWTRAALALALSLTGAPLLWLWVSTVGGRLGAASALVVYAACGVACVAQTFRFFKTRKVSVHDGAVAGVLLLGLLTRLLAVRDMVFPAWVDSSHHFLIARVFAEGGGVPATYAPLLPQVERFYYHFGYHVILVAMQWLSARPWAEVMKWSGQILQALMPLGVYAATEILTRRPRAALWAALCVALVSFFPGYYVSWGRYTQLTGLLVLAPLLGVTWRMVEPKTLFTRRDIFFAGALWAGLLLAHYRVLAFGAVFAVVALAVGARGGWKRLGAAAFLGAALTAPWLWRLWVEAVWPIVFNGSIAARNNYNAFPWDYFKYGLETQWLMVALVALGWAALRRQRPLLALVGWVAVTAALLNLGPGSWLVNNNAWVISLFLPAAMVLGWAVEDVAELLTRLPSWRMGLDQAVRVGAVALWVGALAYALPRGALMQINLFNFGTRLVTGADEEALAWVAQNTPPAAVLAVNGWEWIPGIWAGSDGGAWLWPQTLRRTTLPPVDYIYQRAWATELNAFNKKLSALTAMDTPEAQALLDEQGVTHIFIGARGGALKPELFAHNAYFRVVFTNGAAWVFERVPPP